MVFIGKKIRIIVCSTYRAAGQGMVYKPRISNSADPFALKFLPEEMNDDQLALQRFERGGHKLRRP
jgi:hypothetical protein